MAALVALFFCFTINFKFTFLIKIESFVRPCLQDCKCSMFAVKDISLCSLDLETVDTIIPPCYK